MTTESPLLLLLLLLLLLGRTSRTLTQGIPLSPCPKVFQYRFDGREWFGLASVRNPDYGEPLHLRIALSMRGKPRTNYLGEIELLTRGQFKRDTPILYKVRFPQNAVPPKLVQIAANDEIVCLGTTDQGVFVTQIQLEHTRKFTYLPSTAGSSVAGGALFDDEPSLPKQLPSEGAESIPKRTTKEICGRVDSRLPSHILPAMQVGTASPTAGTSARSGAISVPLVTSEDPEDSEAAEDDSDDVPSITRGAWPWMAAIYVNNLTSLAYQCGGTLVSARVVISAAHCFHLFKQRYTANEVLVFLGRHNLKNWNEEGSVAAPCDDIYTHPDYNNHLNNYDADIAVVVLKDEVRFNAFIRPACLWSGSTKLEYVEGAHGTVVGWGLGASDENGASVMTRSVVVPKIIDAPIVSNEVCFRADKKFRSLSSNRTFCAGVVASDAATKIATATTATATTATATATATATTTNGPSIETTRVSGSQRKAAVPCTGDSGAGLMIWRNERWFLRGTVSASLPVPRAVKASGVAAGGGNQAASAAAAAEAEAAETRISTCSENQYVIYTDVAKFLDWILAFTI